MRRKQKTDFYFASFSKAIEFSRQEALMLYDAELPARESSQGDGGDA